MTKIEVIKKYKNGISLYDLSKLYKTHYSNIKNILLEKNIKIRTKSEARRKYKIDENYFSNIDSIEKSYLFGFLMADGFNYIYKKNKSRSIKIEIQTRDIEILNLFKKELKTNYKIRKSKIFNKKLNKNYESIILEINNKKMSEDLEQLGMLQNKSLILKFPNINKNYIWHFIRGYFDGDGSLSVFKRTKRETCRGECYILSSLAFCKTLKNILKKELNIDSYIYKPGSIYSLKISSQISIFKFMKKIYENSENGLRLERKYKKFIQFIKLVKIKGDCYADN